MPRLRVFLLAVVSGVVALTACQPASSVAPTAPPVATTAPAASPAVISASPAAAVSASPSAAVSASPAAPPAASPAASPVASPSAVACTFQLGFAEMRRLVGAATVGDCLEPERQIPGNGNVEQRTTNGVLVYRAIDGRVLFSNASQTWINRDGTVVTRANNQRLDWEGDRQMVEALRAGGHNVYFRHGQTDPSQTDTDPNNLANCATQRNLTDAGRAQARAIGEAFRTLAIPVGQVLSSPYCRALEYSRLAFNTATPEPSLVLPDPLTDQQKAQNTAVVQRLLATPPAAGVNTIMVAHSPNIRLAANVDLPNEGGAAVFVIDEQGAPKLVARVLAEEWTTLAQVLGPP